MAALAAWLDAFGADLAAWLFSLALIGGYYAWLRQQVKKDPTCTIHGVNELARTLWVAHVMRNPARDIMAVQTFRNFIMGASLMASTASLLIIGTLTLSGQAESIARSWHILNLFGAASAEIWIIKVMCLLVDFIIAFFAFAMAVRLVNHVLFMINVPQDAATHPSLLPESVARRLNRAGRMFAIGMRAFLFSVPLVFWLFGPVFLALASVGTVLALYRLDRSEARK